MSAPQLARAQRINSLFPLGRIVVTAGVRRLFNGQLHKVVALLSRHHCGDWGQLSDEDWHTNELALRRGWQILSVYRAEGGLIWIITEASRAATTILLPDEY